MADAELSGVGPNEPIAQPTAHAADGEQAAFEHHETAEESKVHVEREESSDEEEVLSKAPSAAKRSTHSGFTSMNGQPSFAELPIHLKKLAKEIRKLDPTDLLTISEMTQRITSRELYSLLPYTGSSWYLPAVELVGEDEPQWAVAMDLEHYKLFLTLSGRRMTLQPLSWLLRAAVLMLFWYMLYNILGGKGLMTHGGYVFDPLVTFVVSAIVGGSICRFLQIPPLLGVLWISIMWANIGPEVGYLTSGIYKDVSKIAQRLGLTVVLMRAGFSLSLKSIKPHWKESLMLALLPYGIESVVHGLIAKPIMGFESYTWSFLSGCLCSTASPAVVVPAVLFLQDQGYGKGNGPLSLMMSAVGIEVCLGVWAANFIIGLLFESTPIATAIVLGPIQIIVGALLGIILGVAFHYLVEFIKREAQRLPNGKYTEEHMNGVMNFSFAMFFFFSVNFVFWGYGHKLAGGGAVMTVMFSSSIAHMWIKDNNKELMEQKMNFGMKLATLWDTVIMVALFSMVGIGITLNKIFNSEFFPKAIAIVAASTGARMLTIFAIQYNTPYNWQQKLLVCAGYVGKATAQAAIGPVALQFAKANIASSGPTAKNLLDFEQAEHVQYVAILYVLVNAMVAAIALTKVGPLVLPKTK